MSNIAVSVNRPLKSIASLEKYLELTGKATANLSSEEYDRILQLCTDYDAYYEHQARQILNFESWLDWCGELNSQSE